MEKVDIDNIVISGCGVNTAVGLGLEEFGRALFAGERRFGVMQRPGRQYTGASGTTRFLGAEIGELVFPDSFSSRLLRNSSYTAQLALLTLEEAWNDAALNDAYPERIGLIVGGSNVQQREVVSNQEQYRDTPEFIRPTYGVSFMDSDICGLCTEQFGIRGLAHTLGGASASGQLAVIQAVYAVLSGQVDVCIALGALMDLSYWECQALRSLGAMGSNQYAEHPTQACRPFDEGHDGFIYGESCGAVVIERLGNIDRSGVTPYALINGWATAMDANRNPNADYAGEMRAIKGALLKAKISAQHIDYVNPHGTGSTGGDETELKSLRDSHLVSAKINATKSIIGHGLSAAGVVEIIATLLQMRAARLHPTCNLEQPLDKTFNWVYGSAESHEINQALTGLIFFCFHYIYKKPRTPRAAAAQVYPARSSSYESNCFVGITQSPYGKTANPARKT